MKTRLKWMALAAGVIMALLQLAPSGLQAHPARPATADAAIPANVQTLLRRACMDCHSNEGNYPWYARVAPVSWLIARDITKARAAMDLTEWKPRAEANPGRAMGLLVAACAGVQRGHMPPRPYQVMHREAALNTQEAASFCAWSMQEMKRLKDVRKQKELASR